MKTTTLKNSQETQIEEDTGSINKTVETTAIVFFTLVFLCCIFFGIKCIQKSKLIDYLRKCCGNIEQCCKKKNVNNENAVTASSEAYSISEQNLSDTVNETCNSVTDGSRNNMLQNDPDLSIESNTRIAYGTENVDEEANCRCSESISRDMSAPPPSYRQCCVDRQSAVGPGQCVPLLIDPPSYFDVV